MRSQDIFITESDINKLRKLLERRTRPGARDRQHLEMLAQELERAEVVHSESVPSDVITMHSHARVRDLDSGREIEYTLVFPADADINENKISVLAPIGTALLGSRAGDEFEWPVPGGKRRLKVVNVLYQPEAAGDEPGQRVGPHRAARFSSTQPRAGRRRPNSQGEMRLGSLRQASLGG